MQKICYPALFHKDNDSYWVEFPDLPGCFTNGSTIEESYHNAKEALGLYLDQSHDFYKREINQPSKMSDIVQKYPNELAMLVEFDSLEYAKHYKNKAVKKTLSIPEWLNEYAMKENVNFSQLLQEALIKNLKL